ncbi:hypothetical protein KR009_011894 [Drosophila setifemur]|nr:hypothetical protein KR009_011894 [Drosophila setifemur]
MRLPLLLLLIQSWALVAKANPARHWRRSPAHGVFNVDLYAYNKPRMNLARHQVESMRSVDAPPMGHLLEQISQHSRQSTDQRSHYRNLDGDADVPATAGQIQGQLIEDQAINMQLMPVQLNSSLHAPENLYSSEFHVQNVGAKKIVQLNTLAADQAHKPVGEGVTTQQQEQHPLKVKLTLPKLPENNDAGGAEAELDTIKKKGGTSAPKAPLSDPEREPSTSVKKTMAPSGTIIDMASTKMQQLVSQHLEENATRTSTKAPSITKRTDESRARPNRLKSRRKQTPTRTRDSNETDTKMTSSQDVSVAAPSPVPIPTLRPSPFPSSAKQPAKELVTQPPEISTHRPLATKTKSKSKGKGKGKRRQGSQRRPVAGVMEEEIETTTNWWQILPYTEIRQFLNTIYDTIADDVDDERATDNV